MAHAFLSHRPGLMAAGACTLALTSFPGHAYTAPAQVNLALGQSSAAQSESVTVRQQRMLLKERHSPSAVIELGARQIAANGIVGSNDNCTPQFQDGIPGQPFGAYFSVTARF